MTFWLLLSVSVLGAEKTNKITLDAPAEMSTWQFSNGPEFPGAAGQLRHAPTDGLKGSGAAALDFDFTKGGAYVQAAFPLPDTRVRAVRLCLRKQTPNVVAFRAVDAAGQTFQKQLHYVYPAYQSVQVALEQEWSGHWGGPNDGVFKPPARQFAVLVDKRDGAPAGTLFIDDVELLTSETDCLPPTTLAWYTARRFSLAEPLQATGAPGCRLGPEPGDWRYVFDENHTETSITAEFSLIGSPQQLRIHLTGDASGHELIVTLHSHFQSFRRVIGTLNNRQPRLIEVPLGDMKDWQPAGGQADGKVRLPLRFGSLTLRKAGSSNTGRVQLHRMEIQTRIPADEPVVMIPSLNRMIRGVELSADLHSLSIEPVSAVFCAELLDLHERTWAKEQRIWTEPITQVRTIRLTAPAPSAPMIEARFHLAGETVRPMTVTTTLTEMPDEGGSSELTPESPIGVGLYLYRYGGANAQQEMTKAADMARRAGVKWTREEFQWQRIEPEKGRLDFAFYDQLVDVAHAHGISVYGLLAYWASWTKPYSDEGIDDYANWAAAVVKHYKGRIRHWEIYNEPNIFFWSGPRDLYAKLLKKAYETIKKEDPDAQVLGCSTAGIDTGFIKRTMELGGPFDVLTIHPYRERLEEESFIRELQDVRKLAGNKPVWITEMGWSSQLDGGVSERDQAALVGRTYITALASGAVENVSWYDFREDGTDPFYNEANFGLTQSDLQPKPGYRALATVGRRLAGMKPAGPVDLGKDIRAYRFNGQDRSLVAFWTKQSKTLIFRSDRSVELRDLLDRQLSTHQPRQDINMAPLPDTPLFLIAKEPFELTSADPPIDLIVEPRAAHPGEELTLRFSGQSDPAIEKWQLPPFVEDPVTAENNTWKIKLPAHVPTGVQEFAVRIRGSDGVNRRLATSVLLSPVLLRL